MATVADLLGAPGLEGVTLVAGPASSQELTAALVVEQPVATGFAPVGSVCLLTRAASVLEGYQFDVCLRAALAADVAAVGFYVSDGGVVPRSARLIAEKGSLALLQVPQAIDPGSFCVRAQRQIDGGSGDWLARLDALLARLRELPEEASVEEIAALGSEALGAHVSVSPAAEGSSALSPVTVAPGGRPMQEVVVEGTWGVLAAALCADAATRRAEAARRSEEAPIRSRAGVLAELLLGSSAESAVVAEDARRLGMPVDGWHVVAQIGVAEQERVVGADALAAHALREEVFHAALRAARNVGEGVWNGVVLRSAVVLVCTRRSDPGLRVQAETVRAVEAVVGRLSRRWPDLGFAAGVGGGHEGADGLRASAAEAAAAASLARAGEAAPRDVVGFDAVGLRRMLLAWSGSEPARKAVDDLLAPLDRLGGAKAETAVRTLAVYLAEQGSLIRAGERLHLHRNAVAYRIRRIAELLDADLAQPDDRFALELACRARLILHPASAG